MSNLKDDKRHPLITKAHIELKMVRPVYLRNLLTHTVNNLLQKLNYVKYFKCSVVKQISILFTPFVKISEQYVRYYAKYSLFNLKGSKSKVTKYGI